MGPAHGIVLCLAYILGLLSTGIWWGGIVVLGAGIVCALVIPRRWRMAPRSRIWLVAGIVGLLASLYFQVRVPQPAANDVSRLLPTPLANQPAVTVELQGRVTSLPRLTRSGKSQFWLEVRQVRSLQGVTASLDLTQPVTGNLYVTVPAQQAKGVVPDKIIWATGSLYRPKPAANPGAFDFQKYLQQEGCFAGLRGTRVDVPEQPTHWGWWMVQRRIVRSQEQWLGSPSGPLVSSMVLGSRGVDLPSDLKDQFIRVGLAHALAASGFQTSLILGVVLALTRRCSVRIQFAVGTLALAIFVGLTGLQPAVLRAALMGFGGLVALLLQRKLKPLGALLVTGVLLLLYNPLWIWNLGFQLSFLATLGLLVTVPALTKWLDWLPTAIAPLIAVPVAAYLWTLPLQLYAFGVLSPYSIPVNLMTTPLISLLSLGGMVSALAALIWFPAGSALAWLLYYPAQALIGVVDGFARLPGNAYAVGTISVATAIALYGFLGLSWLQPWWKRHWWLALLLSLGLVAIPAWQVRASLFRVTILATAKQPVMVIQDGGQTALINSSDEKNAGFTVLPFLQTEGVNEIQWAIATTAQPLDNGWGTILKRLPIQSAYAIGHRDAIPATAKPTLAFVPLPAPVTPFGHTTLKLLNADPLLLVLQMPGQTWLWLGDMSPEQQLALLASDKLPEAQVLWWSGQELRPEFIQALRPAVAIASGIIAHDTTATLLNQMNTQVYQTGRDGAVQWTPGDGFKTRLERGDRDGI